MIRDITIGQYYQSNSVIHKLDPRIKIIGTILYIISIFFCTTYIDYLLAISFFFFVLFISKVPFSFTIRGLKPIFIMLIITAMLNLFWTPGKAFFHYGIIVLTWEGLEKMIYMSLRLVLLILGSSLMTLTTTPKQLTDGLESIFSPLKLIKVPVHEIAMMMSIALRFIPILIEETNKIMDAQTARGADFETGNVIHRIKSMIPIFVPLFASAINRGVDLAYAMDARCYSGGNRTKMFPLKYSLRDLIAMIICILYIAVLVLI